MKRTIGRTAGFFSIVFLIAFIAFLIVDIVLLSPPELVQSKLTTNPSLTLPIKPIEIPDQPDPSTDSAIVLGPDLEPGETGNNNQVQEKKFAEADKNKQVQKVAYLTFDDGPSDITPYVLDILREQQVPATFFVIASLAQNYPDYIRRAVADGHRIGNHTYSHKYRLIYSSPQAFIDDISHAEATLQTIIGYRPTLLRAPGGTVGNLSKTLASELRSMGFILHDWNVDSKDTMAALMPAEKIRENVVEQTKSKHVAVILFHDGPGKTTLPEALRSVITELKQEGYQFKTLDHLYQPIVAIDR
ncbi:polysaccharide deacetylase family protein [Heliophilum fasciatum]|uniref:polysaccharide deacetylase family protein n=1 Tax=Heliophilum fasciatum TaxID=35700 RepID=UPI0014050B52|nr:polysaccharide deacetylase family protein [Heliophilum fasciatum]MCW2278506.1 peptidoglycan/xylan/chitin deacetylase (PgdA/CDA1 family) [Heliophilum fasciatum]